MTKEHKSAHSLRITHIYIQGAISEKSRGGDAFENFFSLQGKVID